MEEDQALECFRGRTEGSSSQRPSLPQVPAWRHQSMTKNPKHAHSEFIQELSKDYFRSATASLGAKRRLTRRQLCTADFAPFDDSRRWPLPRKHGHKLRPVLCEPFLGRGCIDDTGEGIAR